MPDEIRNAQVQLGTALSQARAGEDREISRRVREKENSLPRSSMAYCA